MSLSDRISLSVELVALVSEEVHFYLTVFCQQVSVFICIDAFRESVTRAATSRRALRALSGPP